MTWNWSHTQEAYDNVYYNISQLSFRENLAKLPLETLREIAAEIKTYQITKKVGKVEPTGYWNEALYNKVLASNFFSMINKEELVHFIYEFAVELNECTDGGHEASVCPYGCHTVSFSRE